MTRLELKQLSSEYDCIFIDRYPMKLDTISNKLSALFANTKFPQELIDFIKEFWGVRINTKIEGRMYQGFIVKHKFTEVQLNESKIVIGYFESFSNRVNVEFDLTTSSFLKENEVIAKSADDLFKYVMSKHSNLPITILPETIQILSESGWYENRKVSVDNIAEDMHQKKYLLTSEQIAFLEQFSGINGVSQSGMTFCIFSSPLEMFYLIPKKNWNQQLIPCNPIQNAANDAHISMLCIGSYSQNTINLWLSEDGRLFSDQGYQLGRSVLEGFQSVLLDY